MSLPPKLFSWLGHSYNTVVPQKSECEPMGERQGQQAQDILRRQRELELRIELVEARIAAIQKSLNEVRSGSETRS